MPNILLLDTKSNESSKEQKPITKTDYETLDEWLNTIQVNQESRTNPFNTTIFMTVDQFLQEAPNQDDDDLNHYDELYPFQNPSKD